MSKVLKESVLVNSPIKESSPKWKPSVASHRGLASSRGLGVVKDNPLKGPDNATARRMSAPKPLMGNSTVIKPSKSANIKMPKAPTMPKMASISKGRAPLSGQFKM